MVKEFNSKKFFNNKRKKKHLTRHCMENQFPMRDFIEGDAPPEKIPFPGMRMMRRFINGGPQTKFFHNKRQKKHLTCHFMKNHFPMRDFIEGDAPPEKAFSQHKYDTLLYMFVLIGSAFLLLGIISLTGLTEIGEGWWYWPTFACFLAVIMTFYRRNRALIDELEMNKRDVKRNLFDSRASEKFAEKSQKEPPETKDDSFSFCPYCGGSIPELTVYCPNCGYKVGSP